MPFTLASHITQTSGSVLPYKGSGSCGDGKTRVNSLSPYRAHVYLLLWSPITSILCSKEDPTQASQQPGCSFITFANTETIPDWLQLISSWLRTVALHCFQVWYYCVVDNSSSHQLPWITNKRVQSIRGWIILLIQHLMLIVSGHTLIYEDALYKMMP